MTQAATVDDLSAAKALYGQGDLAGALARAERCLAFDPDDLEALTVVSVIRSQIGDLDGAIVGFQAITRALPDHANAQYNLAVALRRARRWDEAAAVAARAARLAPDHKPARTALGDCLLRLGRADEALSVLAQVAQDWPHDADAQVDLGMAFGATHRMAEAEAAFQAALRLRPDHVAAHVKLGEVARGKGDLDRAASWFRTASTLSPGSVPAITGLAYCRMERGDPTGAEALFAQALAMDPDYGDAHYGFAHLLAQAERYRTAAQHLQALLTQDPDHDEARASLIYALTRAVDWEGLTPHLAVLPSLGTRGRAIAPFATLAVDDDPIRARIRAETYATARFAGTQRTPIQAKPARPDRLSVGFFSADFHDHATMFLIAGLLDHLDRDRFAPVLFSYGPDKTDAMRARIHDAGLPFHEVRGCSDVEIADRARAQGLDIAIDLKGHTQGGRLGPFALGLAPVQIHYLGYPGSLGCDFLDYLVADAQVIPPDQRAAYGEALITLPNSYQATDDRRPLAPPPPRADLGLPDGALVLAAFNDPYKITEEVFGIWTDLLRARPQAVLWLYAPQAEARDRLAQAAVWAGLAPNQVVFAPRLPQTEHLARLQQADLFLDTHPCAAHTTASDALWAGLPLVTWAGDSFHARVAASLLIAQGLDDCVTTSAAAYAAKLAQLCDDPAARLRLRHRTETARQTGPLFQTARFTRHVEAALDAAYARASQGLRPADIRICA